LINTAAHPALRWMVVVFRVWPFIHKRCGRSGAVLCMEVFGESLESWKGGVAPRVERGGSQLVEQRLR
jgi:hypothetical protein